MIENKCDFDKLKDIYRNESFALKITDSTLNVFLWYANNVLDEEEKNKTKSCIDFAYLNLCDKVVGDDGYRHYISSKILESMDYAKRIKLRTFLVDSFSPFLLSSFAALLLAPLHKIISLKFFNSNEILQMSFSEYPFAVVHKTTNNIKVILPNNPNDDSIELHHAKILESIKTNFESITYKEYKAMVDGLYLKKDAFKTKLFNVKKRILIKSILKNKLTHEEQLKLYDCAMFEFLTKIYEENDSYYNII